MNENQCDDNEFIIEQEDFEKVQDLESLQSQIKKRVNEIRKQFEIKKDSIQADFQNQICEIEKEEATQIKQLYNLLASQLETKRTSYKCRVM